MNPQREYQRDLWHKINVQRLSFPELCDVSITTNDGDTVNAHKTVLSSCSGYFKKMFSHENFSEKKSRTIEMNPDIDAQTLADIIDYFYTGELVAEKKMEDLFKVARWSDYFDCDSLYQETKKHILREMNIRNAPDVLTFSKMLPHLDLNKRVTEFFIKNFKCMVECGIMLLLEYEDFYLIVKEEVYENVERHFGIVTPILIAINNWLMHDKILRKSQDTGEKLQRLTALIPVHHMCQADLLYVTQNPLMQIPENRCFYATVINHLEEVKKFSNDPNEYKKNTAMFVIGDRGMGTYGSYLYLFERKKWFQLGKKHLDRSDDDFIPLSLNLSYKSKKFSLFGYDKEDSQLYTFQTETKKPDKNWQLSKSTNNLSIPRNPIQNYTPITISTLLKNISASPQLLEHANILPWYKSVLEKEKTEVNDEEADFTSRTIASIILLQKVPLNDVDDKKRDPNEPQLNAAIASDGKLFYVIGGNSTSTKMKSTWCYDPTSDKWKKLADLAEPRTHASAFLVDGWIYLFGGITDSSLQMEKCEERSEIYNIENDEWFQGPTLCYPKTNMKIAMHGNELYLIGGLDSNNNFFKRIRNKFDGVKRIETINRFNGSTSSLIVKPNCSFISGGAILSLPKSLVSEHLDLVPDNDMIDLVFDELV